MRWNKKEVLRLLDNYEDLRARAARIAWCDPEEVLSIDYIAEQGKTPMLSIEVVALATANHPTKSVLTNVVYRKHVVPFEFLFMSGETLKQAEEKYFKELEEEEERKRQEEHDKQDRLIYERLKAKFEGKKK